MCVLGKFGYVSGTIIVSAAISFDSESTIIAKHNRRFHVRKICLFYIENDNKRIQLLIAFIAVQFLRAFITKETKVFQEVRYEKIGISNVAS